MRRINVSIDTLDDAKFTAITRWGKLDKVLEGVAAAKRAGLKIKINTVALRGVNDDEFNRLVEWCGGEGLGLTFIEVMPMGEIGEDARLDQYMPLSMVRAKLNERWTLTDTDERTGGPARYARCKETGGRIGFITPLTHNFCEILQPRAAHLHRHLVYVPGPGRRRRFARAAARLAGRRAPHGGYRRGDLAQAQRA